MHQPLTGGRPNRRGQHGQMIVIAAIAMVVMVAGVALVLEGGNAYAHQRVSQNAADAVADAGAVVLAERLGGATRTGDDVLAAMTSMATANRLATFEAYYTNVKGVLLTAGGAQTTDLAAAAPVAPGSIPPGAQGVRIDGSQSFETYFGRALGIDQLTASAGATPVTGTLTGGKFMPVVFPVSMADCDGSGDLVSTDAAWRLARPGSPHPVGQEFIVPLCKTGGGSFMILDLDAEKTCYEEVVDPSSIQFNDFPVDLPTDTGNDCAKKIENAVTDTALQGHVVMIPMCDGECSTQGGAGGTYHIVRIAAFFIDYISYSNSPNNSACALTQSPTYGTSLVNIVGGNGSSSCVVGWFVRYITSGPVGTGTVNNGEAIGIQLIR